MDCPCRKASRGPCTGVSAKERARSGHIGRGRPAPDIVLAAVHIGTEYSIESRTRSKQRLARALTASPDVDLVYMHHPHVVQPWTVVNKKWVLYGVGNTVAQHGSRPRRRYEGATGQFTFTRAANDRFTVSQAEYIPTLVTRLPAWPASPALSRISPTLKTANGCISAAALLDAQTAYHVQAVT